MKIKTVIALFCAAAPFLLGQAQAQTLRRPPAALPARSQYGLVYLYLPGTSHPQRSSWRWVLEKMGDPSRRGSGQATRTVVEVRSLDSPLLRASLRRIPAGETLSLSWQGKKSDLAHQAGLSSLKQFCASRKIGFRVDNTLSSFYEK